MTARILPVEEWGRLEGTEAGIVKDHLDPDKSAVLVVEDGDVIVGTWVLMLLAHVECLWIAPERRGKAGVAARLYRGMRELVRQSGVSAPMTAATTPEVKAMILKAGGVLVPGEHFALRFER